jgi:hypothetical protein
MAAPSSQCDFSIQASWLFTADKTSTPGRRLVGNSDLRKRKGARFFYIIEKREWEGGQNPRDIRPGRVVYPPGYSTADLLNGCAG